MRNPILSIVICTYNRCEILDICLERMIQQVRSVRNVELSVVDNNSSDETKKIVKKHQKEYALLQYFLEPKQGISHARNRGYLEAKGEWIGYVDDDGLVEKNFLKESLQTIQEGVFDVFGGKIVPWFMFGQPRWLNDNFETNTTANTKKGLADPALVWGSAMFVNKQILQELGGFSPDFGMKGNKIAYGEETHLVFNMQAIGAKIGMNPAIIVRHLVAKKKLKLWWHVESQYARGRDAAFSDRSPGFFKFCYYFTFGILVMLFKGLKRLIQEKNFYLENYFLFVMKYFALVLGNLVYYFSALKKIE